MKNRKLWQEISINNYKCGKIGVNLGEAKMDNKWKETLICDLLNFLFRIYMVQYAIFRNSHQHLRNLHNFDYNILGSCRLKSFVPSFFRVFTVLLNCFTYQVSQKKRPLKSKTRNIFHRELTLGNETKCLW